MSNLIAWIIRAIPFGTIIMFGSMGEITTEKSGNLNLGVPGIMYLGGFAGFASSYFYEKNSADPKGWICVILALVAAIAASMLGGLIFSFLTITLRANQNVTGLALTTFGMGVANFFGVFILNGASYTAAPLAYASFSKKIPFLSSKLGIVSKTVFAYGFLVYAAIIIAVVLHYVLNKTRVGLNLRAVGENPGTADAAGINVTKYKYLATCIGAGLSGIGGLYYVLDYNQGIWATTGTDRGSWLAGSCTGYIYHMETSELYLGCVSFRYALLAVSVPSKYSWNQGCKLCHRPDPDGSLCGYHYRSGCSKLPKEERKSASGKSGTFLLPRGKITGIGLIEY